MMAHMGIHVGVHGLGSGSGELGLLSHDLHWHNTRHPRILSLFLVVTTEEYGTKITISSRYNMFPYSLLSTCKDSSGV